MVADVGWDLPKTRGVRVNLPKKLRGHFTVWCDLHRALAYNRRLLSRQAEDEMAEAWEQWHGEVIGGEFRLRQYLGGSDHSAVFLADRNRDSQPVVLKLVPSHPATADSQLACWEQLRKLSHPYLLHILSSGRCQLGNSPFLYAVIERADENLAQILPPRALT
jgi:hypothetical protein